MNFLPTILGPDKGNQSAMELGELQEGTLYFRSLPEDAHGSLAGPIYVDYNGRRHQFGLYERSYLELYDPEDTKCQLKLKACRDDSFEGFSEARVSVFVLIGSNNEPFTMPAIINLGFYQLDDMDANNMMFSAIYVDPTPISGGAQADSMACNWKVIFKSATGITTPGETPYGYFGATRKSGTGMGFVNYIEANLYLKTVCSIPDNGSEWHVQFASILNENYILTDSDAGKSKFGTLWSIG